MLREKCFSYEILSNFDASKNKLLEILWMTATMRRNFELFGSSICLDMMKRGINTLLWPYTAVVMHDEANHICVACEGIVCDERFNMYKTQTSYLARYAPGLPLQTVNVVAGDVLFDKNIIEEMGFPNARFIMDKFHLLDSGLKRNLARWVMSCSRVTLFDWSILLWNWNLILF